MSVVDFIKMSSNVRRINWFLINVLIVTHLVGCIWYFLAKINDFDDTTWAYHSDIGDDSEPRLYMASIYWALTTITTVGFGDVRARNDCKYRDPATENIGLAPLPLEFRIFLLQFTKKIILDTQ